MISIKKILVPTDFTNQSVPAVGYAISLAKEYDAEVVVVHTVSPKAIKEHLSDRYIAGGMVSTAEAPVPVMHQANLDALLESRKQLLHNFLHQKVARELLDAVKITPLIRLGKVVDEIMAAAKEVQCDIIIMTSHASRLRRLFHGSFAERVVRKAPCPVLTIQPSARVRTMKDERVPARLIDRWAA